MFWLVNCAHHYCLYISRLNGDPAQGQWYTPPSPPFSRHVFQEMFVFVQDTFVSYVRPFIQRFWVVHIFNDVEFFAEAELACELTWCVAWTFLNDFPLDSWGRVQFFFPNVGRKSGSILFGLSSETVCVVVVSGLEGIVCQADVFRGICCLKSGFVYEWLCKTLIVYWAVCFDPAVAVLFICFFCFFSKDFLVMLWYYLDR